MKKPSLILFSILILFFTTQSFAEEKFIQGTAKVIDGDSIKIQGINIRLIGIDAPEKKQLCFKGDKAFNCGLASKTHLEKLIKQERNNVICSFKSSDKYGRILGNCLTSQSLWNLNSLMVLQGWAVAYTRYTDQFLNEQEIAKKKRLGLWSTKFDYPEDWRRKYK